MMRVYGERTQEFLPVRRDNPSQTSVKELGRNAEIENAIPGQLEPPLEFLGPFFQSHIGLRVVIASRQVKQVLGKSIPRLFDESLSGMFDDAVADAGSELFIAHRRAAQAEHDVVRRE